MKPQLLRLRADILCLQDVNSQKLTEQSRDLRALRKLLDGTPYEKYNMVFTKTSEGQPYSKRNLIILSRFPIVNHDQYRHFFFPPPAYRKVTAIPPDNAAKDIRWERPILYAQLSLSDSTFLHVINLHLKSRLPSNIPGQKIGFSRWGSVSGWAEGMFISSAKRVGQALEGRQLVDHLFDSEPHARIIVCGDFNAEFHENPVQTILGGVENTSNPDLASRTMYVTEQSILESRRHTLLFRGNKLMLDHLIVSPVLINRFQGAEIHNEMLSDESVAFATDIKFPASDHAPVVAEFLFPLGDLGEKPIFDN